MRTQNVHIYDDGSHLKIVNASNEKRKVVLSFNKTASNFDTVNAYIWTSQSSFVSGNRRKHFFPITGKTLSSTYKEITSIPKFLKQNKLSGCVFIVKTPNGFTFALFVIGKKTIPVFNINDYLHMLVSNSFLFCGELVAAINSFQQITNDYAVSIAEKKALNFIESFKQTTRRFDYLFI